jgi:hypothetical protein
MRDSRVRLLIVASALRRFIADGSRGKAPGYPT